MTSRAASPQTLRVSNRWVRRSLIEFPGLKPQFGKPGDIPFLHCSGSNHIMVKTTEAKRRTYFGGDRRWKMAREMDILNDWMSYYTAHVPKDRERAIMVKEVVAKMLQWERFHRFNDMGEVKGALLPLVT